MTDMPEPPTIQPDQPPVLPASASGGARPSIGLLVLLGFPVMGIVLALLVALSNPPATGPAVANPTLPAGSVTASGAVSTIRPPGILNQPAPPLALTDLDGEPVTLDDFAGRVVFINFWATWCIPCVRELPTLQAFAAEQAALANGAVVLGINNSEDAAQIRTYLTDNDFALTDIRLLLDTDYTATQAYGIYNLPTTYVVAPDGILREVKYGEMSAGDLDLYLQAVSDAG